MALPKQGTKEAAKFNKKVMMVVAFIVVFMLGAGLGGASVTPQNLKEREATVNSKLAEAAATKNLAESQMAKPKRQLLVCRTALAQADSVLSAAANVSTADGLHAFNELVANTARTYRSNVEECRAN